MGLEVSRTAVPDPGNGNDGYFRMFRLFGVWPTLYKPTPSAAPVDVLEAGLILAFIMLFVCFLVVLPGVRGKERWNVLTRVVVSLFLGACVILCNWGQEWEVDDLHTEMQYRANTDRFISAKVGIKIGLRNVNITLLADEESQRALGETINYNERFWWVPWSQGRIGFGPYAASFNQEFRAAQAKGVPYPVLWVAEYFTFDGEGIRWGRHYRLAGWYTHMLLWLAFSLWVLANILFFMNPRIGAYVLIMMGGVMLLGNILWATIRNPLPLKIPFEGPKYLEPHYGWCFWLNLVGGALSVILGALIIGLDTIIPDQVATFFGVDVLKDYEEFYPDSAPRGEKNAVNGASSAAGTSNGKDTEIESIPAPQNNPQVMPRFRKKGFTIKSLKQKRPMAPPRRAPPPEPVSDDNIELYENVNERSSLADERKSVHFGEEKE